MSTQVLGDSKILNYIKPVGYEVSEKTSMLSKEMRHATLSVAEDPTIQKTNLAVLGETQVTKNIQPKNVNLSKGNKTFYKKSPFIDVSKPDVIVPTSKGVNVITKNEPITPKSNTTLKNIAKQRSQQQMKHTRNHIS